LSFQPVLVEDFEKYDKGTSYGEWEVDESTLNDDIGGSGTKYIIPKHDGAMIRYAITVSDKVKVKLKLDTQINEWSGDQPQSGVTVRLVTISGHKIDVVLSMLYDTGTGECIWIVKVYIDDEFKESRSLMYREKITVDTTEMYPYGLFEITFLGTEIQVNFTEMKTNRKAEAIGLPAYKDAIAEIDIIEWHNDQVLAYGTMVDDIEIDTTTQTQVIQTTKAMTDLMIAMLYVSIIIVVISMTINLLTRLIRIEW